MTKPTKQRARNMTPADIAASKRLKALWMQAVARRKGTDNKLDQHVMAGTLERFTGKGSQGAISQYLNGGIALNYKAVLAFAEEIGCAPEDIRSDLPEQRAARSIARQQHDARSPELIVNQIENDIDALGFAVSSLFAALASERPGEGARLAEQMKRAIPDKFAGNGLVRKLVAGLEKGARKARKGQPASSS